MPNGNSLAKTSRPSARGVLPRDRLFAALDASQRASMLWLHGPPGCGKSSLVSSYLERRATSALWYQVDAEDSDPATLCLFLARATEGGETLPLFTAEYRAQPRAFARHFFSRLFAALEAPFLIVFDNYQELEAASPVHSMLSEGVAALPAEACIVVLSRAAPPPEFIRLRANRDLEVMGWAELRLTREESDAIVHASGIEAEGPVLEVLYARTQGWAAGLILTLEHHRERGLLDWSADPGAPELLFDYLAEEVFMSFDESLREFLIRTACVDELTTPLATALSGDPGAAAHLETLSRRHQLVTVRPGSDGPVYACHPLLREYLRARAEASLDAGQRRQLAARAADLLRDAGMPEAELRMRLVAGDEDELRRAVLCVAPGMLAQGRADTLNKWLLALPERVRDTDPWTRYWLGACRFEVDPGEAHRLFESAFALFDGVSEATDTSREAEAEGRARACARAMDAIIYALDDLSRLDPWIARAESIAGDAFTRLAPEARARLAVSLFMALVFRQPQHRQLAEWAERALAEIRVIPDTQLRMYAQLLVAINLNYTGQFERALEYIDSLRRLAEGPGSSPLVLTTLKAVESMYYMLNADSEQCLRAVLDGIEIARETGVQVWSHHLLSNGVAAALGAGDLEAADELLERLGAFESGVGRLDRACDHYYRAWLAMLRGDIRLAFQQQRTALALAEEAGCPFYEVLCRLALAQVLVARGDRRRAVDELRTVRAVARHIDNRLLEFQALLCFAGIALDDGRRRVGLAALRRALQVGREHGFKHHLWWQPEVMARLCKQALEADVESDYVRWLIRERGLKPPQRDDVAGSWPWRVRVRTLGGFEIQCENAEGRVPARLSGKPLALLKALAGLGGDRVREEVVAGQLWPRIGREYAHRSLTTALHRLRKILGDDRLVTLRHGRLSLEPDLCWIDIRALDAVLAHLDALVAEGEPDGPAPDALVELAQRVLALYRGPFMQGESPDQAFAGRREQLRNRVLRALDDVARCCERHAQAERALGLYRRALELDPLAEGFHRRLMLCLRQLGRSAEAVEAFGECKSIIGAALGRDPSAETHAIYQAVLREL